ncbi:tripartite motif-containing protein 16-like [Petromyzon marinus]|uniref:tripartite motif-containing protein 16-like n=1 Tax=Petromyzon marinus TaxID=7757 RepID=UPI003F730601
MAADVACDHCGGGQTPAVRSCLRCEMSFCATHLRPHVENPRLRDHVLVAPIANLEERRCPWHRKELEFYCTVDSSLVCSTCTIAGEHTGHRVVTLQEEQETRKEALRREMAGREKKKTTAESRTQQLRGDYNRMQESLRGTRARISREFERRRERLMQEEREALERVDEEGRSMLSRIQADIDRYETRACGLEREINQLLVVLDVQDPLTFLQVAPPPFTRRGGDPLHENLRSSISQETQDDPSPVSRSLNLAKVISVGGVPTKLLPFLDGRSPTLDANSAHDGLRISSDLRTVTWSDVPQGRPHHPHRFDGWRQSLCSESFSSGQHYWEVDVGNAEWCRVGVAYGTIPRRGDGDECGLGESDASWCLQKRGSRFSVWHGGVVTSLLVPEPPRRVGVHLDWDAGLLSFYNADSMALLHSFNKTFTQPLHPGLGVGLGVGWLGVMGLVMLHYKVGDSVRIVGLSGAS